MGSWSHVRAEQAAPHIRELFRRFPEARRGLPCDGRRTVPGCRIVWPSHTSGKPRYRACNSAHARSTSRYAKAGSSSGVATLASRAGSREPSRRSETASTHDRCERGGNSRIADARSRQTCEERAQLLRAPAPVGDEVTRRPCFPRYWVAPATTPIAPARVGYRTPGTRLFANTVFLRDPGSGWIHESRYSRAQRYACQQT